jgi:ubiquinone biosynthesis protein Coq4
MTPHWTQSVDPALLPYGLRAIKTVLTLERPLHPTQERSIELIQRLLLRSQVDFAALEPITVEALAAALPGAEQRARVIRGILLLSLLRGEVSPTEAKATSEWARALGVDEPSLANQQRLAEGHLAMLRFDVNRRAFTGQAIAQEREREGLLGLLRNAASRMGLKEDTATVERFEVLATLPAGSLGRALLEYYERNHFPTPGKKHALPSVGVVHDLCHVLSGYGVDGEGEVEVVCFTSGFMRRDPLSTAFFVVLQAQHDVQLVAVAKGQAHALDDPKLLERAALAAWRGLQVNRDLFDHWDYWPELAKPLDGVRRALNVIPAEGAR